GRIIGRSGRNIRSIELATGADLVVDDTPEAIIISCFDPVRREVARLAVAKLVADGRIHPARVEKVVEQAQKEVEQLIVSEVERSHALIGADLARRYGVHAKVVNAIASHHGEEEMRSVEAMIVEAADAISGARPGARRETLEIYIKRLQALEEIATSFEGVA